MRDPDAGLIGARLVSEGLLAGNFGNLSVRDGDGFLITATGSFLDDPGELVPVPLAGLVPPRASSEWRVHHAVYSTSPAAAAIVHAHPPYAVALSFSHDLIRPIDSEGRMVCPEIPVVDGEPGSAGLAENIASALAHAPIAIARGHGTFAAGPTLLKAYLLTAAAEHACRVLWLAAALR